MDPSGQVLGREKMPSWILGRTRYAGPCQTNPGQEGPLQRCSSRHLRAREASNLFLQDLKTRGLLPSLFATSPGSAVGSVTEVWGQRSVCEHHGLKRCTWVSGSLAIPLFGSLPLEALKEHTQGGQTPGRNLGGTPINDYKFYVLMGALDRIPFSAQDTVHENNSPKHLLPLLLKAGSITQRIFPILAPQKYSQACLTTLTRLRGKQSSSRYSLPI